MHLILIFSVLLNMSETEQPVPREREREGGGAEKWQHDGSLLD